MNKKEARRKKHQAEKRNSRDILDSSIIGGDDDVEEFSSEEAFEAAQPEEEETLLGNLAPVKQIPLLVREMLPVVPLMEDTLHLAAMGNLFEPTGSEDDNGLIGLLLVNDLAKPNLRELAPGNVGLAVQVRKFEKSVDGTIIARVKGICRFENLGILPQSKDYLIAGVRWFEDEFEPESIIAPHYKKYLENMERLSKAAGERMKLYFSLSRYVKYNRHVAEWSSFLPVTKKFEDWFSPEERKKLLRIVSTSERLQMINERAEKVLPLLEKRMKSQRRGENN